MTNPEEPKQVIATPPELPAAPRPGSMKVNRIVTFEPRVRFWIILTALFVAAGANITVNALSRWADDRSLVLGGIPVQAVVSEANGTDIRDRRQPWNSVLKIKFNANGQSVTAMGTLREKPDNADVVLVGQAVRIKYDPNNPQRWTDRTTSPGFAHSLIAVYMLLPVILVTALVAAWLRSRLMSAWKTGKLTAAAVLTTSSSPIAPGYALVTAVPTGAKGAVKVYVPRSLENPRRGDVIWLLMREKGPAVAARAFL